MSAERWLAERTPPPPNVLRARLGELLDRQAGAGPSEPADALADAAERVLTQLLQDGCATRHSALDLLVADALATYAFEAAAEQPERIVARTERAMVRIAALAGSCVGGAAQNGAADRAR